MRTTSLEWSYALAGAAIIVGSIASGFMGFPYWWETFCALAIPWWLGLQILKWKGYFKYDGRNNP